MDVLVGKLGARRMALHLEPAILSRAHPIADIGTLKTNHVSHEGQRKRG
jgi:hypothetical protein